LKVVHIVDHLGAVGGVRTYLEVLLPALAERGIESLVVTADEVEATFAGAPVSLVPGIEADGAALSAMARRRLSAAVASAAPDVVYVHVASSPEVAREAIALAPRVLVYAHDYGLVCPGNGRYLNRSAAFCEEGLGTHCLWRAYTERTMNRRPDRVVRAYRRAGAWRRVLPELPAVLVASPFMARQLVAGGAREESVTVVSYPVLVPAGGGGGESGADVLYVGRVIATKGVDVLLQAVAALPGVTLAIAGDGPDKPGLESLAAELGIVDRVDFVGWVSSERRLELFRASRVLAFPARWQEPFGLVGVEALAAGLPVVASEVGGIPHWLEEGQGGLLVPPGDPGALAGALGRVLGDEAERGLMAALGPEVAARFSVDRHLELLLPELQG
jgi:glycosyltransferase involved in cell wall biosynthesis